MTQRQPLQREAGMTERLTCTVSEAAEILGISRAAAYEAVHHKEIPSLRFGRRIVVPVRPLLRMLDEVPEVNEHDDGVQRRDGTGDLASGSNSWKLLGARAGGHGT